MKLPVALLAGLAAASILALPDARAGVVLEYQVSSPQQGAPATGTVWVGADRIRMETQGHTMIFRGDKQVLWYLQPSEGTYMEMDKAGMQEVSSMMAAAQAQLANLPPEQRAMVEKAMGAQMGAAGGAPKKVVTTVTKTGKSETINGYPTMSYDVLHDGKRDQEAWVTDWKRFELTSADFKAFESMAEFMKEMTSAVSKQVSNAFITKYSDTDQPDALPGVPIRTISFTPQGEATYEMKKITRQDIPASQFEVPSGLRKSDMRSMMHQSAERFEASMDAAEAFRSAL